MVELLPLGKSTWHISDTTFAMNGLGSTGAQQSKVIRDQWVRVQTKKKNQSNIKQNCLKLFRVYGAIFKMCSFSCFVFLGVKALSRASLALLRILILLWNAPMVAKQPASTFLSKLRHLNLNLLWRYVCHLSCKPPSPGLFLCSWFCCWCTLKSKLARALGWKFHSMEDWFEDKLPKKVGSNECFGRHVQGANRYCKRCKIETELEESKRFSTNMV